MVELGSEPLGGSGAQRGVRSSASVPTSGVSEKQGAGSAGAVPAQPGPLRPPKTDSSVADAHSVTPLSIPESPGKGGDESVTRPASGTYS